MQSVTEPAPDVTASRVFTSSPQLHSLPANVSSTLRCGSLSLRFRVDDAETDRTSIDFNVESALHTRGHSLAAAPCDPAAARSNRTSEIHFVQEESGAGHTAHGTRTGSTEIDFHEEPVSSKPQSTPGVTAIQVVAAPPALRRRAAAVTSNTTTSRTRRGRGVNYDKPWRTHSAPIRPRPVEPVVPMERKARTPRFPHRTATSPHVVRNHTPPTRASSAHDSGSWDAAPAPVVQPWHSLVHEVRAWQETCTQQKTLQSLLAADRVRQRTLTATLARVESSETALREVTAELHAWRDRRGPSRQAQNLKSQLGSRPSSRYRTQSPSQRGCSTLSDDALSDAELRLHAAELREWRVERLKLREEAARLREQRHELHFHIHRGSHVKSRQPSPGGAHGLRDLRLAQQQAAVALSRARESHHALLVRERRRGRSLEMRLQAALSDRQAGYARWVEQVRLLQARLAQLKALRQSAKCNVVLSPRSHRRAVQMLDEYVARTEKALARSQQRVDAA